MLLRKNSDILIFIINFFVPYTLQTIILDSPKIARLYYN